MSYTNKEEVIIVLTETHIYQSSITITRTHRVNHQLVAYPIGTGSCYDTILHVVSLVEKHSCDSVLPVAKGLTILRPATHHYIVVLKTLPNARFRHNYACSNKSSNIYSRFPGNSEANTSERPENLEEFIIVSR